MKLKKYLQQQAEKDAEALLNENDEQFIKELVQNDIPAAVQPKYKKSKKFWAGLASIATVLVAIVIIMPVVFVNRGSSDVRYQDADIVEIRCQFEEMQSTVKNFKFEVQEEQTTVFLNYDSVSNDKLYYTINGSSIFSDYKFTVLVNDKYNLKYSLGNDLTLKEFTDYTLNYEGFSESSASAAVLYKGEIKLGSEIIYIEYQQLVGLGEQAFFDDIQSMIKVKN